MTKERRRDLEVSVTGNHAAVPPTTGASELHYACVSCAEPIGTWGMCETCSRAYGLGVVEERERHRQARKHEGIRLTEEEETLVGQTIERCALLCEEEGRARFGAMDSVANVMAAVAKRMRELPLTRKGPDAQSKGVAPATVPIPYIMCQRLGCDPKDTNLRCMRRKGHAGNGDAWHRDDEVLDGREREELGRLRNVAGRADDLLTFLDRREPSRVRCVPEDNLRKALARAVGREED